MRISEQCIDFIKSFESFKEEVYVCPGGYKTIGYGHLIRATENLTTITHEEGIELLKRDIKIAEVAANRLTHVELSQNQFDMLVSFTFNLGSSAYQRSTLRSKVNRAEHELVPAEFMRWVYAKGKILPGLAKRRRMEAEIYAQS